MQNLDKSEQIKTGQTEQMNWHIRLKSHIYVDIHCISYREVMEKIEDKWHRRQQETGETGETDQTIYVQGKPKEKKGAQTIS